MKTRWVSVAVGLVGVLGLAACDGSPPGAVGGFGGMGSGGGGAGGGSGGGPDCVCACTTPLSLGGCADKCDDMKDGDPTQPNYCNMTLALSQCATCLMNSCKFSAADLANDMACP